VRGPRLGLDAFRSVSRGEQILRCAGLWHVAALAAAHFDPTTRTTVLTPGQGLPGRGGVRSEAARRKTSRAHLVEPVDLDDLHRLLALAPGL